MQGPLAESPCQDFSAFCIWHQIGKSPFRISVAFLPVEAVSKKTAWRADCFGAETPADRLAFFCPSLASSTSCLHSAKIECRGQ